MNVCAMGCIAFFLYCSHTAMLGDYIWRDNTAGLNNKKQQQKPQTFKATKPAKL